MGFARSVTALCALAVAVFYLLKTGDLSDIEKWICIAAVLAFSFAWIVMGTVKPVARVQHPTTTNTQELESQESEQESELDIPEPITEGELDGATLRERKLAKIQAAETKREEILAETLVESEAHNEEIVEVTLEMEDVHVADEFVVEVSPDSVENADIESSIAQRRIKHDTIRKKIELRRRGQMADIRASTARMWEEQTAGEDLVALLQAPGHGQSVLVTPENPESGHIYGATFIRIDDTRILKLRSALDDGFEKIQDEKAPEPSPFIGLDGNALPPLLGPDGAPLILPLPIPSASSALAQMKDEMDN
ncbi:MAG: hypothetical protein ACKVKS_02700 [Candidatus Poseidoniales archaeon]|jgi:hypothetical protein|tara:strand:+ start:887 stop:1813 length:927 start_codon:yes stop_codon:yes gene_type:complete